MDYYMRIYICLFLIWRFNPFSKHRFDELDKKIVFMAGMIILSTTALNQYLIMFKTKIANTVLPIVENAINMSNYIFIGFIPYRSFDSGTFIRIGFIEKYL
jgi:hypothetical protein